MINELFSFQKTAVSELRMKTAMALNNYRDYKVPQVVSLQAPTGSGKTIIMASLIEDIYFGSESFAEQPDAIFVWLSDSPQLNEQSKQKIDNKADKIRMGQCVVITDESFDQEILDDGHIYFLNTQKLSKSANLSQHSDTRQYTIWETIENTAKEKSDRLYFIIDEAHRGMQGTQAGKATTIMQRFLKGSTEYKLSPVPVVIGMSATAERFNRLVGDTTSTLQKVIVPPSQVRASGLLKDRIVITYPEDIAKYNEMSILQAATDEWISKCQHWYQYTYEQHYANVNPVFVIQVKAGSGNKVSDTDLDDILAKIEERLAEHLSEGEVVHTFGSTGTLEINGLNVPHIEPSDIAENRKVRVVLFKENLSTGWDCPRAETMMSFRVAEDATYIAQLLGRMVRTPLQCRVLVDDSLNDVRLYLPYFNKGEVKAVIDELQSAEGGDIPTVVEGESLEEQIYVPWTVHTPHKPKADTQIPGQISFIEDANAGNNLVSVVMEDTLSYGTNASETNSVKPEQHSNLTEISSQPATQNTASEYTGSAAPSNFTSNNVGSNTEEKHDESKTPVVQDGYVQMSFTPVLDREEVIRFINTQGYLTYMVRSVKINSYLKSLLSLAGLLTQNMIYLNANDEVKNEVTDMIHEYVKKLHSSGKYEELAKNVTELKLSIQIFYVFGEAIKDYSLSDYLTASESDLDRQLRAADAKLGGYGFPFVYGRRFVDFSNPNGFKIDCILFAADEDCMRKLGKYAEEKFHAFNDQYRKYVVSKSEKCRKQYSDIIADGDIVSKHNFTLPETISARVEADGIDYTDHLFADANGHARIKLNGWEAGVLQEEQKRPDFVCWLRNKERQSWAMCLPYDMENVTQRTYPDFMIIRKDDELGYVIDLLEPHNPDFKDNLGKAKAFAQYAIDEPRVGRIQLIRESKDAAGQKRFKRLDMAKGAIRNKVLAAINTDELDHIFDTDGEFQD